MDIKKLKARIEGASPVQRLFNFQVEVSLLERFEKACRDLKIPNKSDALRALMAEFIEEAEKLSGHAEKKKK
jgi:metal-responsive CopG/Arc/MetJ family transcriptional regulator